MARRAAAVYLICWHVRSQKDALESVCNEYEAELDAVLRDGLAQHAQPPALAVPGGGS